MPAVHALVLCGFDATSLQSGSPLAPMRDFTCSPVCPRRISRFGRIRRIGPPEDSEPRREVRHPLMSVAVNIGLAVDRAAEGSDRAQAVTGTPYVRDTTDVQW